MVFVIRLPICVPSFSKLEHTFASYSDFRSVQKKEKRRKFVDSYLRNSLKDLIQI